MLVEMTDHSLFERSANENWRFNFEKYKPKGVFMACEDQRRTELNHEKNKIRKVFRFMY